VWSILGNVLSAPEWKVYAVAGWRVQYMCLRSSWFVYSFLSSLVFCLVVLSFIESGVLRSLIVVAGSISTFYSMNMV